MARPRVGGIHSKGVHHGPVSRKYKPPKDTAVNNRSIDCPDCGAKAGDFCTTANGKRTIHVARRRLVIREMNNRGGEGA